LKRVLICSVILIVIIISSISMIFVLKSYNRQMTEKIDSALLSWNNNDKEETLKKVEELNTFWKKYYVGISFIVQNDKIEHINTSVAKLKPLLKCNNDEFYAECESIKYSIKILYDSELPKLHSLI